MLDAEDEGKAEAEVAEIEAKGLLDVPESTLQPQEEEKKDGSGKDTIPSSAIIEKTTVTEAVTASTTTADGEISTALVTTTSSTTTTTTSSSATNTTTSMTSSTSWQTIAKYAIYGAAGAAALYSTAGVVRLAASTLMPPATTIVRGVAARWAWATVEEARSHAEFLYPLVNTYKEMHLRVQRMQGEMEGRDRVIFHGFFLEVGLA
jgi:hypothetical protein